MAYSAITSGEITSGEPVSNTTQTKIKDNFDNHETRIEALEAGGSTVYPPMIFRVNGVYSELGTPPFSKYLKTVINFNLTITGVFLYIDVAGSANSTQIDLLYKRGGGAYQSIFSTKPSVSYSAGNDSVSSNAVINASYRDLQAGDILALDITAVQTGGTNFVVRIDYNKT